METAPAVTELLRWCLARTRSHIRRHGLRLTQSGGQLGDLYVGIDEAMAVLGGAGQFDLTRELGLPEEPPIDPVPAPQGSPLARLAQTFALDPVETRLLGAAAGASLGVDVARLYAFAWADFAVKLPPVSFLAELVADDADGALAAVTRLRPDARLRRAGLLRLQPPEGWGGPHAAFVHHGVLVPDPVLAALRGEPPLALSRATLRLPTADPPRFSPPTDALQRLGGLVDAGVTRVMLLGPRGCGRGEAARMVCAARGRSLLEIDLDARPDAVDALGPALDDLLLDARLHGLAVLLRADALLDGDDHARISIVEERLAAHDGPTLIVAHRAGGRLGDAPAVRFERLDGAMQRALWQRELGDAALASRLVARFDVTPGIILRTLADARREAAISAPAGALDEAHIARALRRHMRHALDGLGEPVSTTLGWDDVVLPDDVVGRLREIRAHARHRAQVYDRWGFRRKMDYGRGLSCLFSGPPGTGKTMMAGIIAHDLGRELYKVDLSQVVSKWVGETEKNLGRIFDEAEQAQVILFFDEADSLFSTRTEVKGANDRFANMEVNYLLQRMEAFDGVSILTTNFERGLDEAFRRRLKFRVHFPLPDAEQRTELWRRMIPPEMPVEDAVDFERLGRKHKMSGGNIKNAVLRAAFYAAEDGGGLNMKRLQKAADAESREMGRL